MREKTLYIFVSIFILATLITCILAQVVPKPTGKTPAVYNSDEINEKIILPVKPEIDKKDIETVDLKVTYKENVDKTAYSGKDNVDNSESNNTINTSEEQKYTYLADEGIPIPQLPLCDRDFEIDIDVGGVEDILLPDLPDPDID